MNNNDPFNQYIPSFQHGSDLSFHMSMGLEHKELAFNSYYSPKQNNATNNSNQNLYRPYDNDSTNHSDDVNGGGVVHSTGSLGNHNVLGTSSNAFTNLNEKNSPWPYYPDTSYSNYPHFQNANFWPQLFHHNSNFLQPNAQNLQHPPLHSDPLSFCLSEDDSNESVSEIDVERSPLTSPDAIQTSPLPSTFPSDLFLSSQNHHQPFAPVYNKIHHKHQLPIRPIPQQAIVSPITQNVPFMCSDCGQYCSSSNCFKKHLDFCNIIRSKLKKVDAMHVDDSGSPYQSPNSTVDRPLNLSSDSRIMKIVTKEDGRPKKADGMSIRCEPNVFTELLPEENNNNNVNRNNNIQNVVNVIQSNSISVTSTSLPMPDLRSTVLPISVEQGLSLSPIASNCIVNGRERKCPQCPLILRSERSLVEHLVSHNISQPFECSTCGTRFSRKFHMARHMKLRGCDGSPPIQFECEFCGKHFSRKDNMLEHVKGHMGQKKMRIKLPCPVPMCEKKLSGRTQLQVHLNFHYDSRPYSCNHDDCNKTFRSNNGLKKHLLVHSKKKLFQCSQCDACFGTKHSLARHMNCHDLKRSAKSYDCRHCGMDFIHKTKFYDHIKTHPQRTKAFECEICCTTYKQEWRLKNHYEQIHEVNLDDESNSTEAVVLLCVDSTIPILHNVEGNVTYNHACDRCPRKFEKRQALKSHYLTHFQGTLLACTECSFAYIRRDCLLRHLRTKHNLLPDEAVETMKKMNPRTLPDEPVASLANDVESVDLSTTSIAIANEPQDATSAMVGEIIDVNILEGNIIELLSILVDRDVMRSFGWPNCSVDIILQSVLGKCGKEPLTQPHVSLVQRLRGNTQKLFSFLVDDQTALGNLFSRRPVEQVLEQVIDLARNAGGSNSVVVQLPL